MNRKGVVFQYTHDEFTRVWIPARILSVKLLKLILSKEDQLKLASNHQEHPYGVIEPFLNQDNLNLLIENGLSETQAKAVLTVLEATDVWDDYDEDTLNLPK